MERCHNCRTGTDDYALVKAVWSQVFSKSSNSVSYIPGREMVTKIIICPKCAITALKKDRIHMLNIFIPIIILLIPVLAVIMHYININQTGKVTIQRLLDIQHFLMTPQFYTWLVSSAIVLLILLVFLIMYLRDIIVLPQKAIELILREEFYGLLKKQLPKTPEIFSEREYIQRSSSVEKYFSKSLRTKK